MRLISSAAGVWDSYVDHCAELMSAGLSLSALELLVLPVGAHPQYSLLQLSYLEGCRSRFLGLPPITLVSIVLPLCDQSTSKRAGNPMAVKKLTSADFQSCRSC